MKLSFLLGKHRRWTRLLLGTTLLLLVGLLYYYRVQLFVRCFRNETCARLSVPILKWYLGPKEYAILHGIREGFGEAPLEEGQGIGRFTFKSLPDLILKVPRHYISFLPDEPDGEIHALYLRFYFPGLIFPRLTGFSSYREALNPASYCIAGQRCPPRPPFKSRDIQVLKVEVFLREKAGRIQCFGGRDGECLGPEFALFQVDISSFQASSFSPEEAKYKACDSQTDLERWGQCGKGFPFPRRSLEQGVWDPSIQLTKYTGKHGTVFNNRIFKDAIYLKLDSDPSNPGEWIMCKGSLCEYHYFRDELFVRVIFFRDWIAQHHRIRAEVEEQLNQFIHKQGEE